jgi:hypothetical protein
MNNKENQILQFKQRVAVDIFEAVGEIHEVLHAVSINPLHSPAMNSCPGFHPQPLAGVDTGPAIGDEPSPSLAVGPFIKIPPTGRKPAGERIGHSCD